MLTLSKSTHSDAFKYWQVCEINRLLASISAESVSPNATQGWKLGEVHAGEMLTSYKSILSDAFKHWHVGEGNRLERRAITESGYPNATQGWQLREVHAGEVLTFSKSTLIRLLSSTRKVCKGNRLQRSSTWRKRMCANAMCRDGS